MLGPIITQPLGPIYPHRQQARLKQYFALLTSLVHVRWAHSTSEDAQKEAASALLHMATNNTTTQVLIAKSSGIPPLIQLVSRGSPAAQEFAARALCHLSRMLRDLRYLTPTCRLVVVHGLCGFYRDL